MTKTIKGKSVIVVGEDYSQNSAGVLKAACSFAETWAGVSIHLVHVVTRSDQHFGNDEPIRFLAAAASDESSNKLQAERVALKAVTLSAAAIVAEHGAHVFGHLRVGKPAREIVQLASDLSADLVVVGTHGRKGMMKQLLGSVARTVLTYASCPVLVVKPRDSLQSPEIEPPCADCVAVRRSSPGERFWCERHSQHHASAHTYYMQSDDTYGLGAQSFRGSR